LDKNYTAYTRKWRPQVFEDIIGQEQVTIPLKRAIELNRVMQAYIFSGPRGVGKTTTARVLAKALNCKKGPTVIPCGVCSNCIETAGGSSLDVIEIDGASNNSVDNIRELRERVGFGAANATYKIYIIDEVHMLSTGAFNALLKTLEEPPPHVIFVFATTDPDKIPQTIISRCQHFRFKRMSLANTVINLKKIAAGEKTEYEEEALQAIAKASDGALRDAQKLFDQAVTFAQGKKLTTKMTKEMLGNVESGTLNKLLTAIIRKDIKTALGITEEIIEAGFELKNFMKDMIEQLRNIMIIRTVDMREMLVVGDEEYLLLKELAAETGIQQILLLIDKAMDVELLVMRSHAPGIVIEAFVAEAVLGAMENPEAFIPMPVVVKNEEKKKVVVAEIEKTPPVLPVVESPVETKIPEVQEEEEIVINENEASPVMPEEKPAHGLIIEDIEEEVEIKNLTKEIIASKWDDNVITRAKNMNLSDDLVQMLAVAGIMSYTAPELEIIGDSSFSSDFMKTHSESIKAVLKEEFKKDFKLVVRTKDEYKKNYAVKKEVSADEAKNIPIIKKLEKYFNITNIEVKKNIK